MELLCRASVFVLMFERPTGSWHRACFRCGMAISNAGDNPAHRLERAQ